MPEPNEPDIPEEPGQPIEPVADPVDLESADDFQERIKQDIEDLKKTDEELKEMEEKARAGVETRAMPTFRPWMIVTAYCLIVAVASYIFFLVLAAILLGALKLMFGIPWLFVGSAFLIPIIPAILIVGVYIFFQFDNLFVIVESGKGGIRRYWNTPIHEEGVGGKNYKPLQAGLVCAPRPFYEVEQKSLAPKTFDIEVHTITVQKMPENTASTEAGVEAAVDSANKETKAETAAEKLRSTFEFSGKFTLEPDDRDFRSLIILDDYIGGMDKAGSRNQEALVRAMQRISAGSGGPRNQSQALAMGEFVQDLIEAIIHLDLIETGTRLQTINPNIKLPKVQIDAIQAANTEGAQKVKEEANAMTAARSMAITLTGKKDITDQEVVEALEKHPPSADLVAFLVARQNNTLGSESSFQYKKLDTGSKLLGLAAAVKEVTSDAE